MKKFLSILALLPALLFAQNSFTDSRDGKTYKTVKIGSRTWMAENLNYDADGSKCYDNEAKNCQKYGRLYDFNTAEKSCPTGWHLPTMNEFERLLAYKYELGDKRRGNIGKRFKARNGWNGTDAFGFSALPAGSYTTAEKSFFQIDTVAYLWTSLKFNSDSTWRIIFYPENNVQNVYPDPRSNENLYSIRCIKDASSVAEEKAEREAEDRALKKFVNIGKVETLAEEYVDKCNQISNEEIKKPFLVNSTICSQENFATLINKNDINKLEEELQKAICFFGDKPNFNPTKFMQSCFGTYVYAEQEKDPVYIQIKNGNVDMLNYLLLTTGVFADSYMYAAIKVLVKNKTAKSAGIVRLLQNWRAEIGAGLADPIKNGDLETIKFMHEQGINLQGNCNAYYNSGNGNCINPIDYAAKNSRKIYQYLSEQGYKTTSELIQEQNMASKAIATKNLEEAKEQAKEQIENAIKANKLEEAVAICKKDGMNQILGICYEDLVNKIRKLPLKKINSVSLAEIYYKDYKQISGYVFQNDGKMLLMDDLVWGNTIMVQYAAGYIGDCRLRPNRQIPFGGYAKYLGDKVYTTVLGVRQSVPNYQLLWCR